MRMAGEAGIFLAFLIAGMVAISIAPGYRELDLERAIERAVPGTLALGDPSEVARVDTNSRIISKAAVIIAVLALLLGAVVVINTMAMAMTPNAAGSRT